MAKGMNLDEFRAALASDATIENEKLKKELENLNGKFEELTKELNQYKEWCRALSNRCLAQTGGCLCANCNIESCKYSLTYDDWDSINNFMKKNHLSRDDGKSFVAVGEYVRNLQVQKMMR